MLGTLVLIWSPYLWPVDLTPPPITKSGAPWLSVVISMLCGISGFLTFLSRDQRIGESNPGLNRQDKSSPRLFFTLGAVTLLFASVLVVSLLLNYPGHRYAMATVVLMPCTGILLAGFLLVASNFITLESKIDEKLAERLDHGIASIASDLTQSNLNVAALHIRIDDNIDDKTHAKTYSPVVPELILRQLDRAMHIKESMGSLENVIQARQRDVQNSIHHLKEQQQRARRAVTAAAGGIFVGYFTYEAGEAALKYVHVASRADDRDLHYWLLTDATHQSRTEQKPLNVDVRDHYTKQFHDHELIGQAWLLTITLLASLLAAWLGWRKPPEEQAGGHGGHH